MPAFRQLDLLGAGDVLQWGSAVSVENYYRQSDNAHVAIHRLLQKAEFSPADMARIIAAYDAALQLLRLTDRTDPVTEIVAKKIIEVARNGERDAPKICARALLELGIPLPD